MKNISLFDQDLPIPEEFKLSKLAGNYFNDFVKIAGNPIWKKITVRGVGLSAKTIKRAYKEMEEIKFRGDIIDYLCFLSLNYVLYYSFVVIILKALKYKEVLKIFRSFMDYQTVYAILSCRLILKDETYLDDVFKKFKVENGEFYDGVKEYIFKKINEYLKVEPGVNQIHFYGIPDSLRRQLKKINKTNKVNDG